MSRVRLYPLVPAVALLVFVGAALAAIHQLRPAPAWASASVLSQSASGTNALAVEFTRIALAFAQHQPAEVDSYFGPASLQPAPGAPRVPLAELSQRTHRLVDRLDHEPSSDADADARQRRMLAEARALATVIDGRAFDVRASDGHLSFDDEAQRTYGMVSERSDETKIDAALAALDRELPPGTGAVADASLGASAGGATASLATRFAEYRKHFVVPVDRRRAVFAAALDACRARTAARWRLPAREHLEVAWDPGAPGAWHRYEGKGRSTLTINPAALEFIDTAVDLACHEGYPGHHAQFLLADRLAGGVGASGVVPLEQTVALLRSPVAMLREGAANYAVDLAFPPDERLRFERDTLFPLAGVDPAGAARYIEIRQLVRALEPAIVPILRDYRDSRLSAADAADRLERRALVSSPQALLRFVDDLGPYVLGYTAARDRVARYVASHANQGRDDERWNVLKVLLTTPDPTVLSAPPAEPPPSTN